MKVNEGAGARPDERARPATAKRFAEALRTATRQARSRSAAAPSGAELPSIAARAGATRRTAADGADDALRDRRESFREEARLAPPPTPPAAARPPEGVTAPELRTLVRTLPLAIQTFGVREGAPLALSFGRSLDVEIRSAPRGVEIVLRPEPRLARASAAELRSVVAALAAKGIAVSRAEVRVRGGGVAEGRAPCVDLAAGVR